MDHSTATAFRIPRLLLGLAVMIAVFVGWRHFFFLTDDAFILFRYVSNSMLGYGLVWNPPPFAPVEGYTCWLWVVLLRAVWSLSGVEPPVAANIFSLLFGYATIYLVYRLIARMELPPGLAAHRLALLALVLFGIVTNRTFLAWLSSGLETSLFNLLFTAWLYGALTAAPARGRWWVFGLTGSATLTALSRPDGLLLVLATLALLGIDVVERPARRRALAARMVGALPLLGTPFHLLWRRATYGEWLPNTYYAKFVEPWPESGWRYLASFVLEYALWIWIAVALVWLLRHARLSKAQIITSGVLLIHFAYYTFVISGDHFEYRVYSYLIPLLWVSFLWFLARLDLRPAIAFALLGGFLVASWPLPWIHDMASAPRGRALKMAVPIADYFPPGVRSYVRAFDQLQAWLIGRSVCMRQQEHRAFYEALDQLFPPREEGAKIAWEGRPVLSASSVGVLGWRLPTVAIIDSHGLNDYVIARTPVSPRRHREMAHDRRPPADYVGCFRPNVSFVPAARGTQEAGAFQVTKREVELSDEDIIRCETRFRERLSADPNRGR